MEDRIKLKNISQREFLDIMKEKLNCVSLRGILQFGFKMKYSTLKCYYIDARLLPKSFFENLCHLTYINVNDFDYDIINSNWGQVKGGKKGKKSKKI